ncbi:glycosyltransferase [Methylobacterium nonmethylotrophicum]|uniref:Glycosyltransferase n=1 Tax=Methylobacterium nonmethylotrophicum TaxID=1141884 RepID=A0A4Z0NFT5_9HYPH|nr:glycosyltransferase [Methylobacterium nonmethylotrophicum]TGD94626.1 glycosyltransferase [Methylobacterium nonmethylotrophicum]
MIKKSFRKWLPIGGAASLFDDQFYLRMNPDVAASGQNPFDHYMASGWREGRDPSATFSTLFYKDKYLDPAEPPVNPLQHYGALPAHQRRTMPTHAPAEFLEIQRRVVRDYFDEDFYVRTYDLRFVEDPLGHYLVSGWRQGYEPNADFVTQDHIRRNQHLSYSDIQPFYHYVSTYPLLGGAGPLVKVDQRAPAEPGPLVSDLDDVAEAIAPHFDENYYLSSYSDVRAAGVDALLHYAEYGWKEGRNPSEIFWSEYYRDQYRDVVPDDVNPLYHYVTTGRDLGLKPNPFGAALWPAATAPTEAEWAAVSPATDMDAAEVVVVIPVYKGYEETLRAVHAVLAHPQTSRFALLVINDCGPQAELNQALARLAGQRLFVYLENETNLGFVASVNRSLAVCKGKDVILLNSDAIPFGDWIDRMLWHARAHPDAATLTPLSNNATIASYPQFNFNNRIHLELTLPELDACARESNRHLSSEVPTGIGFCFYMRRSIIDAIGDFDAETFGRGYGEENDFCLRAQKAGYRNLLVHDVFVYHSGGASFDNTFAKDTAQIEKRLFRKHPDYTSQVLAYVEADPAREARIRLDLYRLARSLGPKTVVFFTHNRIGGIVTHIRDLAERLESEGFEVMIIKVASEQTIRLDFLPGSTRAIPTFSFETLQIDRHGDLVAAFLGWLRPVLMHVHSFVGLDWASTERMMAIIRASGPYAFTLHDYGALCHRNDLVTPLARFCGLPEAEACRRCIAIDHTSRGVVDPAVRRETYAGFLAGAEVVLAPSQDIADRMAPHLPGTRIVVRPHEERLPAARRRPAPEEPIGPTRPLRIAALGAIGPHKGSSVLHDLALDARLRDLPIQYRVVGYSNMPERLAAVGVTETGPYDNDQEAMDLLRTLSIDLVLIASIWPETYCYTLSLAQAAGVPPVVFDLGAQAERLRARGEGAIVDPALARDPSALNDLLLGLSLPDLYERRGEYQRFLYRDLMRTYYGLADREAEERARLSA